MANRRHGDTRPAIAGRCAGGDAADRSDSVLVREELAAWPLGREATSAVMAGTLDDCTPGVKPLAGLGFVAGGLSG